MIRFPFSRREAPKPDRREAVEIPPQTPDLPGAETDANSDANSGADAPDAGHPPVESGAEERIAAGGVDAPVIEEQMRMVEAMLFASAKPISTAELASRMPLGCDAAVAVRRLEESYASRGVQLVRVAGNWAFRTAPDLAHLLASEVVEERKLSKAAIETLAIIAYHQPVTRAEIEEIRQVGVSKGTLDLLMEIGWVKLGRRRQTPGRPVTFITTDAFLDYFSLESLKDLPRLEELRQAGLFEARPPVGFQASPEQIALRQEAEETETEAAEKDEAAAGRDANLLI